MIYKIIESGSRGNAVLYFENILVDVGVSYQKLAPYKIDLVLLTHEHLDHFNFRTLEKLQYENPNLIIASGNHMLEHLKGLKNVYELESDKWYDFGSVQVYAFELEHDVVNFGYKIIGDKKIIHATDTHTLERIEAYNYDVYALEHNYCEERLEYILATSNEFEHGYRSKDTHLSYQQAEVFINAMTDKEHIVLQLHESSKYGRLE